MNFQKMMLIMVPVALCLGAYLYLTHIDRTNPIAVANAFTKSMKHGDFKGASSYYMPAKADSWRTSTDDRLSGLKSAASHTFFDGIPATPAFVAVATPVGKVANADFMDLKGTDGYEVELSRLDGKWYVSKAPI